MKKLFCLVSLISIISCSPESSNGSVSSRDGDFNIKVIDSCEYIEYDYGIFDQRVYSLTHKGNCKYCLERNRKPQQDGLNLGNSDRQ